MVCGGSGPSCCDGLACQSIHGVWKCSPYDLASVDLAAEATNATVPGFEESLEHVERNQSENVLVEGNPWITPIGCKEQGGDCSGGQSCCDGLECQHVHGVWKCSPYDLASVDLAAEATNATVPGFEESLEHVERNQSENVLVEGNPWITPIGCKEQGAD